MNYWASFPPAGFEAEWMAGKQAVLRSLIKLRNDAVSRVGFENLPLVYGKSIVRISAEMILARPSSEHKNAGS